MFFLNSRLIFFFILFKKKSSLKETILSKGKEKAKLAATVQSNRRNVCTCKDINSVLAQIQYSSIKHFSSCPNTLKRWLSEVQKSYDLLVACKIQVDDLVVQIN